MKKFRVAVAFFLLIYYAELHKAIYVLSGDRRSGGTDEIELPANYAGKELYIYLAFKPVMGKVSG